MADSLHPAASKSLPPFITGPGETDVVMIVLAVFLLVFVVAVGVVYFRLHALPEQFAHKKVQFQIVCVLALIAMFTHMHIFWIAALLLALVDLPDFTTPLNRIAVSAESLAETKESPVTNPAIATEAHQTGAQDGEALKAQSPKWSPLGLAESRSASAIVPVAHREDA